MFGQRSSGNTGVFAWFWQRISGVLLIPLLYVHYQINHFVPEPGKVLNYDAVAANLANPYWKIFNVIFVAFALYHAMNGLWIIAADYVHKEWARMTVWAALWTIGVGAMVVMLIVIIPFQKP